MGGYGVLVGNIMIVLGIVTIGGVLWWRAKTGIFQTTPDKGGHLPPVAPFSRATLGLVGLGTVAALVGVVLVLAER